MPNSVFELPYTATGEKYLYNHTMTCLKRYTTMTHKNFTFWTAICTVTTESHEE